MLIIHLWKDDKKNLSTYFLQIFLVCVICTLSILDASEYVHCRHIGVCEFLEINGDLSSSEKIDEIKTAINRILNTNPCRIDTRIRYPHLFSSSNNPYDSNSFKYRALKRQLHILSRYINLLYNQNTLHSPFKESNKIQNNQSYNSCLIKNCLPSQTLQNLATSIINS